MAKKKPIVTNAMRMLDKEGIKYDAIEYETDGTVEENFGMKISEKTGIPPEMSYKTLVLKSDKAGMYVACIPVNCELDLKKAAQAMGEKKVEMIHVKDLLSLTGYIRGGVSPIGMKKKYPTYIDVSCEDFDKIAISAGICGCTLIINRKELITATNSTVVDIIRKE